jgi:hypothetical protein
MAKDLTTFGPIQIPFRKQKKGLAKHVGGEHATDFWKKLAAKKIAKKQGCYIFALRAAKGYCPWYVGKATKSFKQECFTHHKLAHYNDVLFDGRKGTPVLFFTAPPGTKQKVPSKICSQIETFLVQAAVAENPLIKNRQKTKVPDWNITGVVRSKRGRISKNAQVFRRMMGLRKNPS